MILIYRFYEIAQRRDKILLWTKTLNAKQIHTKTIFTL
jgi:hypothetical protein